MRRRTRTAGRTHRRKTWRRVGALAAMRLAASASHGTSSIGAVGYRPRAESRPSRSGPTPALLCGGEDQVDLPNMGGGPSQARSGGGVRQGAGRCDGDLGGLGGRGGAGAPLFSSFFPAARMADGPCGRRGHSGVSSFLFRRCLRHYPITRDCPQRRTVRPPGLALRKQMPPRIVRVAHRY